MRSPEQTTAEILCTPTAAPSRRLVGRRDYLRVPCHLAAASDDSQPPRAGAREGHPARSSTPDAEPRKLHWPYSLVVMPRWKPSLGSLLLLLVCSLVLAASAGGGVARAAATWHDGKAGLTISYPAGWHVTTRSLTTITQPAQRFVVYSGATPRSLVEVASPRANQALAIVMEQTSVSATDLKQFPPRPKKFTVSRLGGIESFDRRPLGRTCFPRERACVLRLHLGRRKRQSATPDAAQRHRLPPRQLADFGELGGCWGSVDTPEP